MTKGYVYIITKDFNGLPIVFREDGYINMTKAAKHFKKKLSHLWDSPQTQEYLEALSQLPGFRGVELVITKKGRYGGTMVHPKMAVMAARWLDVRFAVWCDLMIDNILKGNLAVETVVPTLEVRICYPIPYISLCI